MSKNLISKPYDKKGLERLIKATYFSFQGIATTFKSEEAFRLEFLSALLLLPIAVFVPFWSIDKILLISSLFLVLIVEILNSAIEWTINYISTEIHPIAKKVKDMGSAAVFLSLCNVSCVWLIVFKSNWYIVESTVSKFFE